MTSPESHQESEGYVSFIFCLFVAGNEPKSRMARENLAQICDKYMNGRCRVDIVDVMENFQPALDNNIFVTPALLMVSPEPKVVIFGSLSDQVKVLEALRLRRSMV